MKSYTEVLRKSPAFFNESIRGDWPKQKVKNDSDRSNQWSLKKKENNIRTDSKVSHLKVSKKLFLRTGKPGPSRPDKYRGSHIRVLGN